MRFTKLILITITLATLISCGGSSSPTPVTTFDIFEVDWTSLGGFKDYDRSTEVNGLVVSEDNIFLATEEGVYTEEESGNLELLADNDGLLDHCADPAYCTRPEMTAITADRENNILYAIKKDDVESYLTPSGRIYQFDGASWTLFSDKTSRGITYENGKLYAIQANPTPSSNDALVIYQPIGETEEIALTYQDEMILEYLDCFSVAAPAPETVYLSCLTGIYSVDLTTQEVNRIYSYGITSDPPVGYSPLYLYQIASGFEVGSLFGRNSDLIYQIEFFSIAGDDYTDFMPIHYDYIGPIYNDGESKLYIFNESNNAIYYYQGASWHEFKQAKELLVYKEIHNLCYLPEIDAVYGFLGTSVVRVDPEKIEYTSADYESIYEACKAYFTTGDLGSIEVNTDYGQITDYHDLSDKAVEFAVTAEGHVIYRGRGGDWTKIDPDASDFEATTMTLDEEDLTLYVGTKGSGIFLLSL